ncbi:MAG: integrase [Burkholderiales bacterium]|nr:integrase [Burkholderiales bacterium]
MAERLRTLTPGAFVTLRKIEQGGALQARLLNTGATQLYWRYTHDGKTDRVAIGPYDPSASPKSLAPTTRGYSIAAAAEACRSKALIQHQTKPVGGYREHAEKIKRTHADRKAKERDQAEQTLAKLLDAYCDHLQAQERRSHADARSIFNLHIKEAWPKLAATSAALVTSEQVTDALRKLIEDNKGRTANKLRAYLRAAYQCALDVNSLPSIPVRFKDFRVTSNPAALTKRSAEHDRADKRPLSLDELRQYWTLLDRVPGFAGVALRLHLLTGGQRIEQLAKLKRADVSASAITIFDAKGRPGQGPRTHVLPLTPRARKELGGLSKTGEFALSTDGGETHVSAATLSGWARDIATAIPNFQLKRVRSGVETALAAAGVSKEVRGQLQSHGLSGVQARHYDAYDYAKEKLEALQKLDGVLRTAPVRRRSAAGKVNTV